MKESSWTIGKLNERYNNAIPDAFRDYKTIMRHFRSYLAYSQGSLLNIVEEGAGKTCLRLEHVQPSN